MWQHVARLLLPVLWQEFEELVSFVDKPKQVMPLFRLSCNFCRIIFEKNKPNDYGHKKGSYYGITVIDFVKTKSQSDYEHFLSLSEKALSELFPFRQPKNATTCCRLSSSVLSKFSRSRTVSWKNDRKTMDDTIGTDSRNNSFSDNDSFGDIEYLYDPNGNLTQDLNKNIIHVGDNWKNLSIHIALV
jgi:hypothetical protein